MPTPLDATTPLAMTTPSVDAPAPVVVVPAPDLGERPGFPTRTKMCRKWCTTTNTWVDM